MLYFGLSLSLDNRSLVVCLKSFSPILLSFSKSCSARSQVYGIMEGTWRLYMYVWKHCYCIEHFAHIYRQLSFFFF